MEPTPSVNTDKDDRLAQASHTLNVRCDESGCICLEGEVAIHEAEYLHHTLVELLKEDREQWTLDLTGITTIDIAGAQILMSLKKTARDVKVHSCPKNIRLFLEQLGLATHLL
jgi:anti-anti-sigma regulatory factor